MPTFVLRHGGLRFYRVPGTPRLMRYRDAKSYCRLLARRDDLVAHAKETGFGDHAAISRVIHDIQRMA